MTIRYLYCLIASLIFFNQSVFACVETGSSTNGGSITPTTSAQTIGVNAGEYYSFSLNACESVVFSFCSNGGSAGFDTELTVLTNGNTQLLYNDDFCGTQSELSFTATASETYHIYITEYGCDETGDPGTLSYVLSTPVMIDDYVLNNDASGITVGGENCVELTPEANSQLGCVWNQNPVDLSNAFNLDVTYYFGDNGASGADGNTFVFKSSGSTCECGTNGAQMGAGGISNALVIEFDTYDNGGAGETSTDHIAVEIDGDMHNGSPLCGPVDAISGGAEIDDGATHVVNVDWDPITQDLKISFDGNLRLTCNNDFITNVFGGNSVVTWGVTSATGGLNNQQYFCPSNVIILPVEILDFNVECVDAGSKIHFTTGEENLFDRFEIQKTYDGMMFETIENIESKGSFSEYEYIDNTISQTTYYRLKMIDLNGDFEYTEIISSDCINNKPADFSVLYGDDQIFLNLEMPYNMNAEVMIMNISGQLIQNSFITGTSKIKLDLDAMSKGVYFVRVKSVNASFDLTKKMVKF